jgi:DNA-binding CsgD family transcriptional regulator
MRASTGHVLRIIESAYRVHVPDAEWLNDVADASRPLIDSGFGVCAFEFRHLAGGAPKIVQTRMMGIPEEAVRLYPLVFRSMAPDAQARPFAQGPCTTTSQMMGMRGRKFKDNTPIPVEHREGLRRLGMHDSLWITAAEPSGWGCGLHAARSRIGWASQATSALWARVCAHLSAATRLRRLATPVDPTTFGAEAIFSSNAHVDHAEGPACNSEVLRGLRHAVLELEKLRAGSRMPDAYTALKSWKGLVAGRWSLLDRFDSDGRRYIIARANEPRPLGVEGLTLRERQIVGYAALGHDNKTIAYDLGIAHGTVRVLVARAASRFQVHSRKALIEAYIEGGRRPESSDEKGSVTAPSRP